MADDFDTGGAVAAYLGRAPAPQPDPAQGARQSMGLAVGGDADYEAELRRVSAQTGVPVDSVRAFPNEVKKQATLSQFDFDGMAQQFPSTAKFLSDVNNAQIAHDDTQNMGLVETMVNSFRRGVPSLKQSISALRLADQAAGTQQLDEVDRLLAAGAKPEEIPADKLGALADQYRFMSPDMRQRFRASVSPAMAANMSAAAETIAAQEAQKRAIPQPDVVAKVMGAKTWGDALDAVREDPLRFIASVGPESLIQSAPGLAAAVPAGMAAGPTGAAMTIGGNSFLVDYASSIVDGLQSAGVDITDPEAVKRATSDPAVLAKVTEQAMKHAQVVGAVDALSGGLASKIALPKVLAAKLAARPLVAEIANIGVQAPTQAILGAAGEAGGELYAGQDLQPGQIIAEAAGEFFSTPGEVVSASAARMRERIEQAHAAETNTGVVEQLDQLAAASKLRQRDPASFEQFVDHAAADGPVQELYLDARALAQSGIDVNALAQVSPSVAEQFDTAMQTGGDVRIPVGEYAAHIAGTEYAQSLIDHLRTDPEGMSRAEAQQFMQSQADEFKAQAEKILEEKQTDEAFRESAKAVESELTAQLTQANRFTPDVNSAYASMLSNFYAVTAQRLGVTPQEAFSQYPLRVAAESVMAAQRLDQGVSIGTRLQGRIDQDFSGAVAEYNTLDETDGGRVLNTDLARELSPEYRADRSRSADVHEPASAFIKRVYAEKLAQPTPAGQAPVVLFTAGGTGAGKSTGLRLQALQHLASAAEIIYDTNMNKFASADQKIQQALAAGRHVSIVYTFRDPVEALVQGALPRAMRMGRTVPIEEHYKTHVGAFETMLRLREKYADNPKVDLVVVDNSRGRDNAALSDLESLPGIADNELKGQLNDALNSEYQASRISPEVFRGFAGTDLLQRNDVQGVESGSGTGDRGQPESERAGRARSGAGEESRLEQSARGQISFGDINDGATIALLQNADLSTFLHESGHFFLEVYSDLASRSDAPVPIQSDMGAILKWFGVPDLATWRAMSLEEKRPFHEQFARAFESYLFEGKAPSTDLQPLFQRFRAWLISVYRSLASLNVNLSDEVRSVFDRMIATDNDIRSAEALRGYSPLFKSAEDLGLSQADWQQYQELAKQPTADAQDELARRGLRDMQWLGNAKSRALKTLQADAAVKRAAIKAEVTDEVMALPIYSAREFLKRGEIRTKEGEQIKATEGHRLSIAALEEMYPAGALESQPDWKKLGYGQYGMLAKDGLHPDIVAEIFGLSSGDELVHRLLDVEKPRDVIDAMTDQRMLERYGDLADPDAINRAADAAVHNDARLKFIATEYRVLSKAAGSVRAIAAFAKDVAARSIAAKRVRDIRPGQYLGAETRAAKAAEKAHKAGDVRGAADAKRNQLINNALAREAGSALDEVSKGIEYLKKFDREGVRKNLDVDYLDQIDQLLERYDLRQLTLKAIDKRKSLAAWIDSQREQGLEPDIPAQLLEDASRKPYKELTVEEFRGLRDTVKQIEHLARLKHKLLTAQDQRTYEAIRDAIAQSIDDNSRGRTADTRTPTTNLGRAVQSLKQFGAAHIKVATWARIMDGGKDGGPVWEYFVRSANAAGDRETTMRAEATRKLSEIMAPVFKLGRMGGKGQFFPTIGRSLNREARLAIALNSGNEGNLQRLLGGEGWSRQQIKPVLDSLTKAEWDAVQSIWNHFESYRPQIAAKERRVYGKEPDWVAPTPVQTRFGEYAGGYYPIKYDPAASQRAEEHSDAEAAKRQLQGAYTSATTRRSFTKSRAEEVKGRPLLYSLSGVYSGVNDVIHDLAWHEWLIDANRLLRSHTIDSAIRQHYGPEVKAQFKSWTQDVAEGERGAADAGEMALGKLRQGVSVAGLGFNVMSALMQPLGLTQSIVRVGAPWIARGVTKYIASPFNSTAEVNDKSEFMANRSRTRFRELNELRNKVQDQSKGKEALQTGAYYLMMRFQQMVDVPTWMGAYEKAIAAQESDARAVALADQAVIDAQGGGQSKDLSAIERGGPWKRLFTTFYSFMNTALNLGVGQGMTNTSRIKTIVDMFMLYTLPAVLGYVLKQSLTPGDDDLDDPEKLAKALAAQQLDYLMGLMFVVREFSEAGKTMLGLTDRPRDYSGPAGVRLISDTGTLAKQLQQGEFDDAFRKAFVNFTGSLFGLPSAQINRSITGVQAMAEGKTSNPAAALFGYQEKR